MGPSQVGGKVFSQVGGSVFSQVGGKVLAVAVTAVIPRMAAIILIIVRVLLSFQFLKALGKSTPFP